MEKYLGLCMAAGGIVTGTDAVLGEVRSRRAKLVIIASDASERTKKQLTDKCTYYGVDWVVPGEDSIELSRMIGRRYSCAAVAVTSRGPWRALRDRVKMQTAGKTGSTATNDRDDSRKDDR